LYYIKAFYSRTPNKIKNSVDTEQPFESLQQIDELRLRNTELKNELEREKTLHKMLFKEWEELTAEMAAQKQQSYENSRPKNIFYKYAFYVLLIGLVPVFYFVNPPSDNRKTSSSGAVSDRHRSEDSSSTSTTASASNSLPVKDSALTVQKKPVIQEVKQQPTAEQPVLLPEEKKAITPDSIKLSRSIIHKEVVEVPLTDDERDSITSLGFSDYFDHYRNRYRKSSVKYKAWEKGWNEAKAEAKKLVEKNPSLK
jgi:hypothetical protein